MRIIIEGNGGEQAPQLITTPASEGAPAEETLEEGDALDGGAAPEFLAEEASTEEEITESPESVLEIVEPVSGGSGDGIDAGSAPPSIGEVNGGGL